MAIVTFRELANHANAPTFSSGSSLTTFFAEDWNKVKSTLQSGSLGIKTFSVQVEDTASSTALYVKGQSQFDNAVVLNSTNATLTVGGTCAVTGTSTFTGLTTHAAGATLSGGDLTVSTGNLDVTAGNITVGGSVDGLVDLYGHDHTGTTEGPTLDGGTAITADTITYDRIKSTSIGLVSSTLAAGDELKNTRDAVDDLTKCINIPATTGIIIDQPAGENADILGTTPGVDPYIANYNGSGGVPCVIFDTLANGGNMVAYTFVLPDNMDESGSITITANCILFGTPSVTDVGITVYGYAMTAGNSGDSTATPISSGTNTETGFTSSNNTNRWHKATHTISSGSFTSGDLLFIAVQRTTFTGDDPNVDVGLANIAVEFAMDYS